MINAPVVPVTTPISGKVTAIGSDYAITVENNRVDNSTLIGLKVQLSALRDELDQKSSFTADYARRIVDLENDLSAQQTALVVRSGADLKAAQAALEMVTYSARIAKTTDARKLKLIAQGAAAGTADEVADAVRLEDAKVGAAKLAVDKLTAELDFARQGVYVGGDLQSLQNLQTEIRTRKADLLQIKMQIATLHSKAAELTSLVMTEGQRVDRLSRADVHIPTNTQFYKPVAASGREVTAGDTLAETLDCRDAFVVAIFSERQAQTLAVGSKVQIEADGWPQPMEGLVEQLVPRTTERVDLDYAVPFPPTERRELYAYIRPTGVTKAAFQERQSCSVGTWVDVRMPHEWFEKTEQYIRAASATVFGIAEAYAAELPAAPGQLTGAIRRSIERLGPNDIGGRSAQNPRFGSGTPREQADGRDTFQNVAVERTDRLSTGG